MLACTLCTYACDTSPTESDGGIFDAMTSMDAGTDAGPLSVCGNGFIEPTESCDDENLLDGDGCDGACNYEARCGDGTLDEGERCDDGNEQWSDGCDGTCSSNEQCGNGEIDLALAEACDDANTQSGDGCSGDCRRVESCGDGMLDANETCDDASEDSFDDCGPSCQPRVAFSVHSFALAPATIGCDFSGDGLADNRIAAFLRAARTPLNRLVENLLGTWSLLLVELRGLDDPSGITDEDLIISFAEGWDTDDDRENNILDGAELLVLASDVPAPDQPRWVLRGGLANRTLAANGGTVSLRLHTYPPNECDLDCESIRWTMARASMQAVLESAGERITGFRDGLLCGALPIGTAAANENPLNGLVYLEGCDGGPPTLADLLLGGTNVLGVTLPAVAPDTDLDGDGIERFELSSDGPPGCQPIVRACIDGDGTRYEGRDCLRLPQFADGFSNAIQLAGSAVRVRGIVTEESLRRPDCGTGCPR